MNALHAIGPSLFCLVSPGVGVRLAALAVRTRAIPESMFAIAFVSAGSIGYGGAAGREPHSASITSALGLTAALTLWCTLFVGKRAPSPA